MQLTYPELCLYLKNFTRDVSTYMQLSDVVIGKPGPGVVSEALVSGRPMILYNEGRSRCRCPRHFKLAVSI